MCIHGKRVIFYQENICSKKQITKVTHISDTSKESGFWSLSWKWTDFWELGCSNMQER